MDHSEQLDALQRNVSFTDAFNPRGRAERLRHAAADEQPAHVARQPDPQARA